MFNAHPDTFGAVGLSMAEVQDLRQLAIKSRSLGFKLGLGALGFKGYLALRFKAWGLWEKKALSKDHGEP